MKPPMRQEVVANVPIIDEFGNQTIDDYGRPETKKVKSKARVQFKSQLVLDTQGQERRVSLEIDLPPGFNPEVGTKLDYTTAGGDVGTGNIIAKEEVTNIPGNKIYSRVVFISG